MNPTAILYSRSFFGFDLRVWGTLIVVIFLSVVLLGFKMMNKTTCGAISVLTQGTIPHKNKNVFYVNESILFTASAENAKKVQWNFDDGSAKGFGAERKHSFSTEGDFMVTAIINGKCKEVVPVTIIERGSNSKSLIDEDRQSSPISGKTFATAGVPETYACNIPASKYKWTIENNATFEEKFGQSVSFSFSDTGTYNLMLELDDDLTKMWKQPIVVRSAAANEKISDISLLPPPDPITIIRPGPERKEDLAKTDASQNLPPPLVEPVPLPTKPAKRYIEVKGPALENMLKEVIAKTRDVPDFDNILCEGGNTMVTANDKSMTFSELCKRLQDRRGIFKSKVKNLKVKSSPYPPEKGCMVTMVVEFK